MFESADANLKNQNPRSGSAILLDYATETHHIRVDVVSNGEIAMTTDRSPNEGKKIVIGKDDAVVKSSGSPSEIVKAVAKDVKETDVEDSEIVKQIVKDNEQEFWDSLSVIESRYLEIKIAYPTLDVRDVALKLRVKNSVVRKLEGNSRIQNFLVKKHQEKVKHHIASEFAAHKRLTSILDTEIEHRLTEMTKERLTAKDLLEEKYNHQEARLILEGRLEGLSTKDLLRARTTMLKNSVEMDKHQQNTTETTESLEMIDDISKRYMKYTKKVRQVDPEKYNPQRFSNESKGIIDIEVSKKEDKNVVEKSQ